MENERSLRQTLRRPKTDEEIFDRVTPAKHSRSTSLLDVHSSRGVHQDPERSRAHDTRAQEHESSFLESEQSESGSASDSDEPLLARGPQKLTMTPRSLQNASEFSQASALSSAYMGCILDDYSIKPFLDEDWPEQLTQWDSSVNRHARFAADMESNSGDEKGGPREAQTTKPISWSTHLSVSEKLELLDKVGEKETRRQDESEPRYLDRVMGLLRLTRVEKEHARALVVARQDFDREEDEMLRHYRLEMHASFLKNPRTTKEMTTEDREKLLEKHVGPVIASAHARFGAIDRQKIDAYWKYCGLDKKSPSHRDYDARSSSSNPPTRKRKGSFGEDEFETYSKAFAAQQQNAARFEGRPLITPEKNPNMFRRFNSASPDYHQHKYALEMGYTHVSQQQQQQHTPNASSRVLARLPPQRSPQPPSSPKFSSPHVSRPSAQQQPGASSSKSGALGSSQGSAAAAVHKDPSILPQRPAHYQQPSKQTARQNTTSTRGGSHDHQHPKPKPPATTGSSSSLAALGPPPRHGNGSLSGDRFAKAHLELPRMPPGVDSIFSLRKKKEEEEGEGEDVVERGGREL